MLVVTVLTWIRESLGVYKILPHSRISHISYGIFFLFLPYENLSLEIDS